VDFDHDGAASVQDLVATYDPCEVPAPPSPHVVVCDNSPVR
jgi:hypothetical protein